MNKSLIFIVSLLTSHFLFSQNIGINATGATPDASAILDVSSTTKGMLTPRMTTAERSSIVSPATGLVVYDTNFNSFYYYNGSSWIWLLSSNNGWSTIGNTGTTAGTNFIGTTDAVDFVTKTNNTEVMRVTSSGNVGIGVTPLVKLDVVGSGGANVEVRSSGRFWSNSASGGMWLSDNADCFIGNISTTHFGFWTNGVGFNALSVNKSNGNIGIGTMTPNAALQLGNVVSNRRIVMWEDANNDHQIYGFGINGSMLRYQVANTGADHTFYAGTSAAASNELMRIKGSGDVGIGISTPANKLQVNSTTNTSFVQTSNSSTGATASDGAVFGLFNSSAYVYNRENADLTFGTNNTRRVTITAGGNVGIGIAVTAAAVPLAVGGNGTNVYGTDIWTENNIHVQGNETMLPGGRGRLRLGSAWNYSGIYTEATSTGVNNDLVLGASSQWTRIGPGGGAFQSLYIPNGYIQLGIDGGLKPGTNTWTIVSDERLKTISGSYNKGLAEILKLNTITYKYKNVGEKKFDEKVLETIQIGFSAQEVQKIFPEAVGVDSDGYLNLNIHAILVAYVNAIKELDAKNKEQEKINNDLKMRIEKLEALLEKSK